MIVQGRKWLRKSGGASSNASSNAARPLQFMDGPLADENVKLQTTYIFSI